MKSEPKAVVLRTAGTNCQVETAHALKLAGFSVDVLHINEFTRGTRELEEFHLLVVPGGFADGDYLGSAKVLANKLRFRLGSEIRRFISEEKLVLGICNGFQAIVKAGILPGFNGNYSEQLCTLSLNDSGHFQDQWVELESQKKNACVFTKGIKRLRCPINHGEGKFVSGPKEALKMLYKNNQVVFKYLENPNGSTDSIAGICDESGRVFGLMPHPEKNFTGWNDSLSLRMDLPEKGEGMAIFENAFKQAKKLL
ncbi:MAG: phosphoribosylformylglycinamidine synthase subunit PurQ [Candidatus Diapherotrites archaeon]